MTESHAQDALPSFISSQVTESRRFFLNLNPNRRSSLEVVCGGVERMRPDYVIDRTDFPYFGIELVAEGKGTFTIHGQEHQLSPGVLFAYGPQTAHTIRNHAGNSMRKYYIDFVGTRANKVLANAGLMTGTNQFHVVSVGALMELTELFEMFIRNTNEDGPLVAPICESLLDLLSLKIAQMRLPEGKAVPRSYTSFERIRRYIDEHFLALHTIQDVAEQCDVTPVYLSRLFKRFADCGAYQYLLRQRMNFAAGLLINEGLLVQDVASRLGMPDPFQFSRAFKRVFGIPPSQLTANRDSDRHT